jgi:hypothetical protein
MARPATSRLKVNPPLGRMPVLQFCAPGELRIDPAYQRDITSGPSQTLIRRIAQHWNWDLCQPLVVARRRGLTERLFVIDGQHRLEAAKLRGDIPQLPCVVCDFANTADEAASFVHLNQQRRPLGKLDVFKAAVASEDPEACAIVAAMADAGLSVAPHANYVSWKPGMVSNIGGIEASWRQYGEAATRYALIVLARAFEGQVLRYGGTVFAGIAAICADEIDKRHGQKRADHLVAMVGGKTQNDWRRAIMQARADDPNLKFAKAAAAVMRAEWEKRFGFFDRPASPNQAPTAQVPAVNPSGFQHSAADDINDVVRAWCSQCDLRVTEGYASACQSRFCPLKVPA